MYRRKWHGNRTSAYYIIGESSKTAGARRRTNALRMNDSHGTMTTWTFEFMNIAEHDWILDVGCGGGAALSRLSRQIHFGHFVGVDYSSVSVKLARKLNDADIQSGKMEIVEASVEKLPFADNQFDKIVTVESFYFWPDPAENLKEVFRTLKGGGRFFLTLGIYRSENMSEEAKQSMETYHLYVPTIDELQDMLKKAGFTDVQSHTLQGEDWLCMEGTKPC